MNTWMCTGWVVLAVVSIWTVALAAGRARRLDRLHVRLDAARAALDAALARRSRAALHAAATLGELPGAVVGAAAHVTMSATADRELREGAENALGRALAGLDREALPVVARDELDEAEQLLALARRVHNDAVRDTLGLRSRRLVRWLHLAGTAPMPAYFEIADPVTGVIPTGTVAVPPAG